MVPHNLKKTMHKQNENTAEIENTKKNRKEI